jgi:hypothetical protein
MTGNPRKNSSGFWKIFGREIAGKLARFLCHIPEKFPGKVRLILGRYFWESFPGKIRMIFFGKVCCNTRKNSSGFWKIFGREIAGKLARFLCHIPEKFPGKVRLILGRYFERNSRKKFR